MSASSIKGVRIHQGDEFLIVNVLVRPFDMDAVSEQPYYFVLFLPQAVQDAPTRVVTVEAEHTTNQQVAELEAELNDTRESLQATIEEVEASNEELQVTNEEMLAANEELQSTNEELQSVNEELHTVNAEHQLKLEEISNLNTEMDNLLKSTEIGTIFLDREMGIRKFTPAIREQFNLRSSDIGRPIDNFSTHIGNATILENAKQVLETQRTF